MKLKDFLATVDYTYNVYVGCLELGYSCVGTDSFNQEWVDYEVKSIEILSYASYQVNLVPPKKPWVAPDYVVGALVEENSVSKGCFICANNICANKKIYDNCIGCDIVGGRYLNWKNLFIKED